jgi:carbon starvation protein CstA
LAIDVRLPGASLAEVAQFKAYADRLDMSALRDRLIERYLQVGEVYGDMLEKALVCSLSETLGRQQADRQAVYTAFGQGSLTAFVDGGANILANGMGMDVGVAATLLTVMAALFAGTTMDTGLRLQRYIFQEWGEIYQQKWMTRPLPATLLAVLSCLLLAFGAGGADGSGGLLIWPLFGTTNDLPGFYYFF